MRSSVLAAVVAATFLTACKPSCCSQAAPPSNQATLQPPEAAAESAPVPDAIRSLREADSALQQGKLDEAIAHGEAASAAAPGNPVIWNQLGRAHAARYAQTRDEAEAKKAREAFSRAIAASPDFWPAQQNLGELEEKLGRLQEAAAAYRKVLQAQPNHPDKARFEAVIKGR
ncbi:MAG TPA: tetratricopeptide repeat protein [Myxococcales bacterium]|nr:tetratricopeptide repeat protein [Myxococcales bacterium]